MIRWSERREIPRPAAAVLDWLAGVEPAAPLSDAEWKEALGYADRFQVKLLLPERGPAWAREEIARDRERNRERNRRLVKLFGRVARAAAGLPVVVLKGFAHWGLFPAAAENRMQYDLDLYCAERAAEARKAIGAAVPERPRGWKWNGDYYDPEIPVAIDLHERLWDAGMEGFGAPGLEEFWERRVRRTVEGIGYEALAPADALAFSALHMLRHLLHGDARPAQAFEIAGFLGARAGDDGFWSTWREWHAAGLRRLEAIAFRLAAEWFGCEVHAAAAEEVRALPEPVLRWLERSAASPITAAFKPNKDELELNLRLAESAGAKARIVRRRLFPARLPRPFSYAVERGMFHLRALGPAVSMMLRMRR